MARPSQLLKMAWLIVGVAEIWGNGTFIVAYWIAFSEPSWGILGAGRQYFEKDVRPLALLSQWLYWVNVGDRRKEEQ